MKRQERDKLLRTLRTRFDDHMHRHPRIVWAQLQARLEDDAAALESLLAMESSGGEPDVVVLGESSGRLVFCDCSPESPAGRRSLCYDGEALATRKEHKPKGSAVESAARMGIELLTEAQYRALQSLDEFDTRTSSWIQTPPAIRALGGALFCDRRFDTVFVYHNGAPSYYAARGFRGLLRL